MANDLLESKKAEMRKAVLDPLEQHAKTPASFNEKTKVISVSRARKIIVEQYEKMFHEIWDLLG